MFNHPIGIEAAPLKADLQLLNDFREPFVAEQTRDLRLKARRQNLSAAEPMNELPQTEQKVFGFFDFFERLFVGRKEFLPVEPAGVEGLFSIS